MAETAKLQRNIGLGFLILYGIGDILGAGIYGLVGKAAGQMGYAVWLAFLTSMIAAGLTGLSYASLGSRYPKAGGASFITLEAYGNKFLSYMIGLAVLASGLTSMATATRVFSGYFVGRFPSVGIEATMILFACAIALIIFRGIRETMWVNAACTLTEVSGLLLIIFAGFSLIGEAPLLDATTAANPDGAITLTLLLSGAVLTFYSFIGFEDILNVGEEVKEPKKNIPRGLLIAVAGSSIIYMLISIIAVAVIPPPELAASKQPLVDVAARIAPWFSSDAFSLIAMFAVANTCLLNFTMGSRMFYGMATHGLLPSVLAQVHRSRGTPHIAILSILVILLILAFVGDISSLARATSVLLLICFSIVNSALILLKLRKTDWQGGFEVPIFVPALGIIVCVAMLSQTGPEEGKIAAAILTVIALLYLLLRPKDLSAMKEGAD